MRKKKSPTPESTLPPRILNAGLNFATQASSDVREALAQVCPELTPKQLKECNAVCQAAKEFGHAAIGKLEIPNLDTIYEDGFEDFRRLVTAKYPWVSNDNLDRLFSQGIMAMLR